MLPLPCRVTISPGAPVRSGPAVAVGRTTSGAATVTITVSESDWPSWSVTVSWNSSVVPLRRVSGYGEAGVGELAGRLGRPRMRQRDGGAGQLRPLVGHLCHLP